jgi:hypothetical protein
MFDLLIQSAYGLDDKGLIPSRSRDISLHHHHAQTALRPASYPMMVLLLQ